MRISNANNNMPIDCSMKGMHGGSKVQQTDKNSSKNVAIKDEQKISMEKNKGNHIDFKL